MGWRLVHDRHPANLRQLNFERVVTRPSRVAEGTWNDNFAISQPMVEMPVPVQVSIIPHKVDQVTLRTQ